MPRIIFRFYQIQEILLSFLTGLLLSSFYNGMEGDSTDSQSKKNDNVDAGHSRPGKERGDAKSSKVIISQEEFDSKEYNMKHAKTGRAVIINNKTFCGKDGKGKSREHSNRDRDGIEEVLKNLGFVGINRRDGTKEKMVFENVSRDDLIKLMEDAGNDRINSYEDMNCFVCVVLSYGESGAIYCPGKNEDDLVELKKLQDPLKGNKCKGLLMKPKMFFIQGCPYKEEDVAYFPWKKKVPKPISRKVPIEADFLTQSCNLPANGGWHDDEQMCWYIRALCEALQKYCVVEPKNNPEGRSVNFLTVLTRVNGLVCGYLEKQGISVNNDNQLPLVTSLLTKHMYFYQN